MKKAVLATLLLVTLVAAQKSYSVSQITTSIKPTPNSCKLSISETITFNFVGDYTQVGRPIPDTKAYKKISIDTSSINVGATTSGVTLQGTPTITRNNEDTTSFILWNFRGPSGGGQWTFTLSYIVDGPLANDGGMSGTDSIYWSYMFNQRIDAIDLNYNFPFSVSDPSVFKVDQSTDVTARTAYSVRVQRSNIPANMPYAVTLTLPHQESNTAVCTPQTPSVLGTILTIVLVCVFVGLCICISIICSIWGAIRRGLLFGDRFGYGVVGGSSYGWSSSTTYYEPSHHHYHSGGGHHHHSGGGGHSSSGVTGSSGFAN